MKQIAFPKFSPWGTETNFRTKIVNGEMIHTIFKNHHFAPGDEVTFGERQDDDSVVDIWNGATVSIHDVEDFAIGFRSHADEDSFSFHITIGRVTEGKTINILAICDPDFSVINLTNFAGGLILDILSRNCGFDRPTEFIRFLDFVRGNSYELTGQIVHWTSFRYVKKA